MSKLIILLLTLPILATLYWYQPIINIQYLLKDISINNLVINGQNYSLNSGRVFSQDQELSLLKKDQYQKVLQLASFYQLTKEEPLFTPYDIDPTPLAKSVEFMEEEDSQLLQELGVKDHIFPISFLKLLPQIISNQKQFINSPSDKSADQLISFYLKAAKEYQQNSSQILKIVNQTLAQKAATKEVILSQFATNTSSKVLLSDLQNIVQNSQKLTEEINNRGSCLKRGVNCRDSQPLIKSTNKKTSPLATNQLISKEIIMPGIPQDQIKGPYQINTVCLGYQNEASIPSHLYYVTSQTNDQSVKKELYSSVNGHIQEADLATEAYFLKLSDNYLHERFLKQHGLPYTLQTSTNPYICQNLEFLATLGQLNSIFSSPKLLFQNLPANLTSSIRQQLEQLGQKEQAFFHPLYPSDSDLDQLGLTYLQAYQKLKSQKNQQSATDRFLQSYLNIALKISNFDQVLNKLTVSMGNFRRRKNFEIDNPLKEVYYFGFRSSYSLTYLPFNPSVWKLTHKLQYTLPGITDNIGFDKRYISYSQLRQKYSVEEILSWFWQQQQLDKLFLQENHQLP